MRTRFQICTFYFHVSSSLTDNEQLLSIQTTKCRIFAVPQTNSYSKISQHPDSNREPTAYRAVALPLSYAGKCADTSLHNLCTRPRYKYSIKSARYHRNGRIRTPDRSQISECSSPRASLRHRLSRPFLRKGYGLSFILIP